MKNYQQTRFSEDKKRKILWTVLSEYLSSKFIAPTDCVLEFGAGYCYFINNIKAAQKYAIDIWPKFVQYIGDDVCGIVGGVLSISDKKIPDLDLIFSSNVIEHLSKEGAEEFFLNSFAKLKKGGKLILLQPNYKYSYADYFDDFTHVSIWTDVSIVDFASQYGFQPLLVNPKFLPLTIKSRVPVIPLLIKIYLNFKFSFMAKQMLVIFQKVDE